MLIDNSTNTYFFSNIEFIIAGNLQSSGANKFTSKESVLYTVDESSILKQLWTKAEDDDNFILSYTFNEPSEFSWEITQENDKTFISLPQESGIASSITRAAPYPAQNKIISNQYVIQHRGLLLPAYNMTVDFTEDGLISGVDSDSCLIEGEYEAGNTNVNIYPVELRIDNCDLRGDYSGLATVMSTSDSVSTGIMVMLQSNTKAIIFTASSN